MAQAFEEWIYELSKLAAPPITSEEWEAYRKSLYSPCLNGDVVSNDSATGHVSMNNGIDDVAGSGTNSNRLA